MDSLKWNAIKFVWICFGLVPFSRFIMIIERFSWHFISNLFVRLPFSHQIHTAWICTGLRTFTYLTVVFVHLIILFFIFNQLNFPNAKVKCNAKSHLKLVSDWYLIKITANKWISLSLFARSVALSLSISFALTIFHLHRGKMVNLLPSENTWKL